MIAADRNAEAVDGTESTASGGRVRRSARTGLWSWCCCGACGFGFRTRAYCAADLDMHCAACHTPTEAPPALFQPPAAQAAATRQADAGHGLGSVADLAADALMEVRGELARVDGKAAALLGLASAGLALLLSRAAGPLPVAVALPVWAAAGCLTAATVLLLRVLGPRLRPAGGADPTRSLSWVGYVRIPAQDLAGHLAAVAGTGGPAGWRADRLGELSALVAGKYRRLAAAVWLLLAAVVLLGAAALVSAVAR